ncbi:hypothetical protein [Streptomyces chartreusis]
MDEPITQLAALAAEHHELYQAWIGAGFTEPQAMELLKEIITANAHRGGQ